MSACPSAASRPRRGREFADETFDHFTEVKVLSRNDAASFAR